MVENYVYDTGFQFRIGSRNKIHGFTNFSEVKLFQVKPDRLDEFEKLIVIIAEEQKQQKGCIDIKYLKRFYIFDDINKGKRNEDYYYR